MKTEEELCELLSRDPHKVQSLCRICLCDDTSNATPLFSSNVGENNGEGCKTACEGEGEEETVCDKMVACGRVRINRDDKLPKLICGACHYDLDIAHLFRVKCQQADALLRKVLEDAAVKHEEKKEVITGLDLESSCEDMKDNKNRFVEINLDEIKQENSEFNSDNCYDDFDEDYVPEVEVKKKKKEKKTRSKKIKNEVIETGQIVLKVESDLNEDNLDKLLELNAEINEEQSGGSGERKYCCHLCNKPLASKYSLKNHVRKMHGEEKKLKMGIVSGFGAERRFHCTECDYKCRRRQALHYHMTTHTGLRPFKCDQCPKSFAQHGSLYTHRKTHSDKMYYTCPECGKQFKHRDIFKNHRRVHSNEFKFVCEVCNKGLKTQKTLNEHMNRHLRIKNFSCEFCGMSFVTRVELANHLRVHNKKDTFKCTFCEYSTYSKKMLSVHIKRHTGERSFRCEHCEYSCYTQGELRYHVRKHTKEQNYSCPVCEMKFRHSTSVNKHMLRRHGEHYKWNNIVDRRIIK